MPRSDWAQLKRSGAAQIARVWVGLKRGLAQPQPTLNVARISLRSVHCDRGVTNRAAAVSGGSRRALCNRSGAAFPIRSPPQQAWGRDCRGRRPTQDVALVQSRARIHHAAPCQGGRLELIAPKRAVLPRFRRRGLGLEEPQVWMPGGKLSAASTTPGCGRCYGRSCSTSHGRDAPDREHTPSARSWRASPPVLPASTSP